MQGIAGDKYGLGFFGLAYYEENKDKLKLVGVDNGNGQFLLQLKQSLMELTLLFLDLYLSTQITLRKTERRLKNL